MTREIILKTGDIVLVDEEDYEFAMSFNLSRMPQPYTTYVRARVKGSGRQSPSRPLHLLLTGWAMTDHKNRNGLDNRRENLREATKSTNGMNKRQGNHGNPFKYKGVARNGRNWRACIKKNGVTHYLGTYKDIHEAAEVYNKAAKEMFGEFALLNIIGEINGS